ncbi:aldose 1-epimerase family protein [Snuella sedimenti]|uniref:Aldose 1-epimerase family protein n=1 Tax=Snuella sedimenti TaxID=2798802 RepID=A0A8J7IMH3_9FLAO|nr:aldose 1-epimerase family protein [Snuella sedimenti]MBJ6367227.1 aldose 1-epimerase family protein [Snuella sedimenti]
MYTIQNNKVKIAVKKIGAELCGITSVKNTTEFMWDANPNIWGSYAPNLFPIIGALKEGTYLYESETYHMPKHGFVRHNKDIVVHEQTPDKLTFKLSSNETLIKMYPFQFDFYISYQLTENVITVKHTVVNLDNKTMYFSLGGHPAFKCPVYDNEQYNEYSLAFECNEDSETHLINQSNGLISSSTKPIFNGSNSIQLNRDLFKSDALVFKDLKSKKVTLRSVKNGNILTVSYHDFPYLGIWAKPNGNYVCIEPWLGIADHETTDKQLKTKEGILSLAFGEHFKAAYSIEIHPERLA